MHSLDTYTLSTKKRAEQRTQVHAHEHRTCIKTDSFETMQRKCYEKYSRMARTRLVKNCLKLADLTVLVLHTVSSAIHAQCG